MKDAPDTAENAACSTPKGKAKAPGRSRLNTTIPTAGRAAFGLTLGALFVFTFALYIATLAPTVLYYDLPELRDSAVFQTRARLLGIPDYTGYPTYIMLAHLFTYLPFGDPAYRVNLASALYAAATVAFIFASAHLLTRRIVASLAGALAFALGSLFWSQAVIAEVYTLNALFISSSLFVLLMWSRTRRDGYLLLGCFLMGLSLTNHITSGLMLAGSFLLVLIVDWRKFLEWRLVLKGSGLFAVGLLPYLYLPIRASMDYLPEGFAWGQPKVRANPPNTLHGFYNLVSGGTWKERMWAFGPSELPERFSLYAEYLYGDRAQFVLPLLIVGLAGGVYLAYRRPPVAAFFALLYFGWLFYALEYNIEDIEYYFIPTFLLLCLLMACGFSAALGLLDGLLGKYFSGVALPRVVIGLVSVGIVALPFIGISQTYRESDMSEDYHGREIMDSVASETARGSTILHHRSPLDYMILVEGRRPDLKLVPYLEERNPYGINRGIIESREAPTYVLFPGRTSTPYYTGVKQSRMIYKKFGYGLDSVDEDVLLYRVVRRSQAMG